MPPAPQLRAVRPPLTEPDLVVVRTVDLQRLITEAVERALGARESEPALLDRERLARALSVSLPTVDRLRRLGLPTLMIVQAPRFELAAVIEWLAKRERTADESRG